MRCKVVASPRPSLWQNITCSWPSNVIWVVWLIEPLTHLWCLLALTVDEGLTCFLHLLMQLSKLLFNSTSNLMTESFEHKNLEPCSRLLVMSCDVLLNSNGSYQLPIGEGSKDHCHDMHTCCTTEKGFCRA